MTTSSRNAIYDSILLTHDWMVVQGIEIPEAYKRRDPLEPGRREKTQAEDRLFAIMMRYFRRTKKRTREYIEQRFPNRKALTTFDIATLFGDEKFEAELLLWLNQSVDGGIALFEVETTFGLSADINIATSEWAMARQVQLLEWFTKTQADVISSAVASFVETPGMTIGDVTRLINARIFDEPRALAIAVTEVTNAYSEADKMAGEQLQAEYPEVPVYKTWWTNNDPIVCPVCFPLHGQSVPISEMFVNRDLALEFDGPPGHVKNCRCWRSTRTRIQ